MHQGDQLLARYRYGGTIRKPYIKELTTPSGVNILRDGPPDHPHNHGIMLAWTVDGISFWEETAGCGQQQHQRWLRLEIAPFTPRGPDDAKPIEAAFLSHDVAWLRPDGTAVLREQRTLTVASSLSGQPRMLSWESTVKTAQDSDGVRITGAAYHGLGTRMVKEMDVDGRFENALGGVGVGATNGKGGHWCAHTAQPIHGKPVTYVMFEAARPPNHPTVWFTEQNMPWSYLSATLGLNREPIDLRSGNSLTLRYGIAVLEPAADHDQIQYVFGRWQQWPGDELKK